MKARHTDRRLLDLMFAALLAMVGLTVGARDVEGQRVGGSIGVSLTVLEPVATRGVEVTAFRLGRDGTASLRTTAPTAAHVSQLVMTRVRSSADGFASVMTTPSLVRSDAADTRARELSYRVDVGRAAADGAPRDVQLRVEYLTVAGT